MKYLAISIMIGVFVTTPTGEAKRLTRLELIPRIMNIEPREPNVIKVMVIDTGIAKHPDLDGHIEYVKGDDDYVDRHGHGTHVAGILVYGDNISKYGSDQSEAVCQNVKIYSCKYFDKLSKRDSLDSGIECVKRAIRMNVDYINISGGGGTFSKKEYSVYKTFVEMGGEVFAAAGNDNNRLEVTAYFPASYGLNPPHVSKNTWEPLNNFHAVTNVDRTGEKNPTSNWYENSVKDVGTSVLSTVPNEQYGYMTGTSQATPMHLHTILKQRCKQLTVH